MERLRSFVISKCPECFNSYSTRNLHGRVEKKPLILPCSHCICESCLVKELKAPGDVLHCRDCSDEIIAPPQYTVNRPEAEYPINYYLLGLSVLKTRASEDSGISFNRVKPFKAAPTKIVKNCNECLERSAKKQCLQCEAPYCSPCFTAVHESARALRIHVAVDVDSSSSSPALRTTCAQHPGCPHQVWCDQCSEAVCTTCLISAHSGHKAKPLEQKNKEVFDSLVESHIQVVNVAARLKATSKKAVTVASKRSEEPLQAERQISDFFSRLHGALLLKQHHLLATLYAPAHGQANDLRTFVNDMDVTIDELDKLIAVTRLAICDRRLLAEANFTDLIQQLEQRAKEPCYLVVNETEDTTEFVIEDEKILETLDNYCTLKGQDETETRYRLVTYENLPEGYAPEPIVEVTKETLLKKLAGHLLPGDNTPPRIGQLSPSVSCLQSAGPMLSSSSSNTSIDTADLASPDVEANYIFDELLPGCRAIVKVVHAVSPNDFYVQKVKFSKKLMDLELKINEINFNMKKKLSNIKINSMYIVQYSKDKKWYRGKVISEVQNGYKVFYVDYGNTEVVPKDKIRQMPTSLFKPPGLALHCSLNGCEPPGGEKWKPDALAKMLKIIGDAKVQITVQRRTQTTLYVDMHKLDPDEVNISIQDALMFFGVAVYLSDVNAKPLPPVAGKNISNPPELKPGEVVQAIISSIVSPHELFIQNITFNSKLLVLHEALQEYYSKNSDKLFVYSPREGALVAAMQSVDNRWYRAKIIGIPGSMTVKVHYVDYGNSEQINWQRIRLLANKFYSYHQMCYKCSLVDVKPVDGNWGPEARCVLLAAVNDPRNNSDLSVVVHSTEADRYRVVLYRSAASFWVCVNTVLVDEGVAISTGSNSTIMHYNTPGSAEAPSSDGQKRNALTEGEPLQKVQGSKEEPIKVPVKIFRIKSPGEFYITLESVVDSLAKMQKDLDNIYNDRSSELKLTNPEVGVSCVVKKNAGHSKWYRGYIIFIGETAQVHLVDTGETIDIKKEELYQLEKQFEDYHDGATKCHLGGIVPPFEDEGWPLTATSELLDITDKSKENIFITGMGEVTGGSLPVNVLIKEESVAGALEPTRTKWTSINNLLRKNGLAKSDGTINWDTESSYETVNKSTIRILDEIMSLPAKYHGLASNIDEAVEALPQLAEKHISAFDLVSRRSPVSSISTGPDIVTSIPPPDMPTEWLPSLPFERLEFIANPTYVDNDCSIFIQDFQKSIVTLKKINEVLENCCKQSLPMPYDFHWELGDTCICRYHADQQWYRGVITDVSKDQGITVLMVDYGSIEDRMRVEDLRKMPLMVDVPIQGQLCQINKVKPIQKKNHESGNKWSIPDLDLIHQLVVEKHCPVVLEPLPDNRGYEIVKMTLPSGVDLFEFLVKENHARFASEDEPLIKKSQDAVILEQVNEVKRQPLTEKKESSDFVEGPFKKGTSLEAILALASVHPKEVLNLSEESNKQPNEAVPDNVEKLFVSENELEIPPKSEQSLLGDLSSWVSECERAGLGMSDSLIEATEPAMVPSNVSVQSRVSARNPGVLGHTMSQSETEDDLFDSEESEYMPLSIPVGVDKFDAEVQVILKSNVVVLQIGESNDISLQHTRKEFAELMSNINKEADKQPVINNPHKGTSCVARFSADKSWYRGCIYEIISNDNVLVKYVDYGNLEILPISEVRQLKFEWTGLEVQGLEAELFKVHAPVTNDSIKVQLQEALCGKILKAVVKKSSPHLAVELYELGSHRLAYQDLIDSGALTLKDD